METTGTTVAATTAETTIAATTAAATETAPPTTAAPTTTAKATAATTKATTTAAGEQPLVFDDPLLEKAVRDYLKRPSAAVYPSDFRAVYDETIYLTYQPQENMTVIDASRNDSFHLSVTGRVTSYQAFAPIPFKNIVIGYTVPAGTPSTTYTFNVRQFTQTRKLQSFTVFGNHETDLEKSHIQSIILQNFNSLAQCASLTALRLYDCQGVDLGALSSLKNLLDLEITNCSVSSLVSLKNSPKLKYLHIDYNPVTDLSPLAGNASLEYIYLANLTAVDSATLLTLPNLKKLDLVDCPLITRSACNQLRAKGVVVTFYPNLGFDPPLPTP